MTLIQAIIYGLVQGLGEFLPISSSAHLIAIPLIFGWQEPKLAFDVALHMGTLVAVIIFFWKDWIRLIRSGFTTPKSTDGKLFWFIVIASIPGALIGKIFQKQAETVFRNLALMGTMMIIMGIILYIADKYSKKQVDMNNIGFRRSFLIGISQALAIIPGVSRSGITMTTGLFAGLSKEAAARFSFLLSTPIIFGAGMLELKDIIHTPISSAANFIVGMVVAGIVGFLCIKYLLNYLKNHDFKIFVIYRFIVGIIFIVAYMVK